MGRPVAIDLFAGAGGLSWGLHEAGFETKAAIEQDKWAAETFQANFPDAKVVRADIENFTDEQIRSFAQLAPALIAGGPPCQGFSHSNILNRDSKDYRNSLFREFLRWVEIIQPAFFLIENVPGLLTMRTERGDRMISVIQNSIDDLGYEWGWRTLQAADFGVPQHRERLFIIGAKTRELLSGFSWPDRSTGRMEHKERISLWDAISDLSEFEAPYSSAPQNHYQRDMRERFLGAEPTAHQPMKHTTRVIERFRSIDFGKSESSVESGLKPMRRGNAGVGSAYSQNSRRQHPNLPCNTIVASSHTNYIHPYFDRNFTVRELMRIQSFPDNYTVRGKRAVLSRKLSLRKGLFDDVFLDQRMQIGNAVPPRLAKALGLELLKALAFAGLSNAA